MAAPLEGLLRFVNSGYRTQAINDDMYKYFGGDDILAAAQKYDPNAHWVEDSNGGGEGGANNVGRRLEFDHTKLPASARGTAGYDLRSSNHAEKVRNPNSKAADDENYGSVRNSLEFLKDKDQAWTKYAPMLVGGLAGAGGMGLLGAGIAGGTSAVTGGAAGLAAGNIASGGASNLLTQLASKAPQYARQISTGSFDLNSILRAVASYGGGQLGIPGSVTNGAISLASLANQRKR